MNTDLLFQLYAIHSPSYGEKRMRKFIKRYIWKNCGEVKIVQDKKGNLLCTKGESKTYPCLASHMDQVQHAHSKDFKVITDGEVCFGYSAKSHMQQGLGADDKNGIFICLELLKTFDVLKVAFFVEEEVGCGGSEEVDLDFFKDCRFIIQPDRKGHNDLITSMFCGRVCSDDFIKAIGADLFGYKEDHGTITDVGTLCENGVGISCLNLSCGYYNAHTDEEITILPELENCMMFVYHIVRNCTDVYPFDCDYFYGGSHGYGSYGCYSSRGYDRKATDAVPTFSQLGAYKDAASKVRSYQPLSRDCYEFDDTWKHSFERECYEYDYYEDDYYTDRLRMKEIIDAMPELTFGDIYDNWVTNFMTDDRDILYGIYEELREEQDCAEEWNMCLETYKEEQKAKAS